MGHHKRSRHLPEAARSPPASQPPKRRWLLAPTAPAAFALTLAVVIAALFLASLVVGDSPANGPKRAAIVDQAATYYPDPEFVAAATDTLEAAGYAVDYYPAEEVTVDLYRELPTNDYDLLVLRVHSASERQGGHGKPTDQVVLFTSEPYDTRKYYADQAAGRLAIARYDEGGAPYFGIPAPFVTSSMKGDLAGTTIIMMGCDGLTSLNATAMAFLARGAESFTSWDAPISWGHSDAATERLLQLMLIDGLDTVEAVQRTAAEVGPDPVFGAQLRVLTNHR
jgi:hypothetical protein